MNIISRFYTSSIGKKWVVAITGVILLVYVAGHMVGNLQIFIGPAMINTYAMGLHAIPALLWFARIVLLAAFIAHIATTILLARQNRIARGQAYAMMKPVQASVASRTMMYSGGTILAFVIFHVLHFTTRSFHPEWEGMHDAAGRYDVYSMVILGFHSPLASLFYVLAVGLLCLHLTHGFQSFTQTLGASNNRLGPYITNAGRALAILIFIGYISIPAAALAGKHFGIGPLQLPAPIQQQAAHP